MGTESRRVVGAAFLLGKMKLLEKTVVTAAQPCQGA